jgi:hypothetical protein
MRPRAPVKPGRGGSGPTSALFTVADASYFVGTVALLNSLRITGCELPLTVLDRGMTSDQRRLLEPHCDIVVDGRDRHGYLCKLIAPLRFAPSGDHTVVLIDSDIIVVGSLDAALDAAAAGSVYAFAEPYNAGRWFTAWTELFGLGAPLRRGPAVNSGFVAFSPSRVPGLLERGRSSATSSRRRAPTRRAGTWHAGAATIRCGFPTRMRSTHCS